MISQPIRPRIEVLAEIEDVRHARPAASLGGDPGVGLCGMLCGYRSYSAMAEGGRGTRGGIC